MERREFLSLALVPIMPSIEAKPEHLINDPKRPWMMLITVPKDEDDGEEYHHGLINFSRWSDWIKPYPSATAFKLETRTCIAELNEPRHCWCEVKGHLLTLPFSGTIEVKEMKYGGSDSFYTIRANKNSKCMATQKDIEEKIRKQTIMIRRALADYPHC
jgi:hypothetical protein